LSERRHPDGKIAEQSKNVVPEIKIEFNLNAFSRFRAHAVRMTAFRSCRQDDGVPVKFKSVAFGSP
jgi:hypothetical protein